MGCNFPGEVRLYRFQELQNGIRLCDAVRCLIKKERGYVLAMDEKEKRLANTLTS
jgi:hypothetical protein